MRISTTLLFLVINLLSFSVSAKDVDSNRLDCFGEKFKPKSEASIASMTPRQLVEELVAVQPSAFDTYDEIGDYEELIEKRIRKKDVRIKVLSVLTEYFDKSYKKQSSFNCDKFWVDTLYKIAWDLDRFEFRLRGEEKGRQAIDAFERAIKRAESPGFANKKVISYYNKTLDDLKGTGEYDRMIQDTFLIRKSMELSDDEMLKFSNYLVELDPNYPKWSYWDFIKDYSRPNDAGIPLQRHVLLKPERFYEAYVEFKKELR